MDLEPFRHEPDIARAHTLPATWYTDPRALESEIVRVFARTWQFVGHATQVLAPGDYFTAEIAGSPIVIVRTAAGELKGHFNVCRHRAGPVATGAGNCKVFKCAYHGWLYGLDGALRTTPEFTGVECFDKADFGLKPIAVDTWGPYIFARLSGATGGPSLQETLGAIPAETASMPLEQMSFYKRSVYEVQCNWKVYVDNYLEGYHIPQVHLGLLRELDYPQYQVETFRYYSKQHAPVRAREGSLYRRNLAQGADAEALYYWVFPNLMLNVYPDNLQINVIVPLGPDKTATVFEWYLLGRERPEVVADFAPSMAFSDTVQQEDIKICEAVQRGLKSRAYDKGRFSVQREGGVHHFHGLISEFQQQP